jgi:hypothetical protein
LGSLIGLQLTVFASETQADDKRSALQAKYHSLKQRLRTNQFGQPLVLDSTVSASLLQGDIYAEIDFPISKASAGLSSPDHWCELLLLHINTKYCHPLISPSGTMLLVNLGHKSQETLSVAPRIEFRFSVPMKTEDYAEIVLEAPQGPFGTSHYRILLEVMALSERKTFLHLAYSYAVSFSGQLAMKAYLNTIGRGKVGFTRDGGSDAFIGGARGLVERNTMRYYLAIESFLGATDAAPAVLMERRLQNWFTATEEYPRQLHEMDRAEYLEMKRAEYLRQQVLQ